MVKLWCYMKGVKDVFPITLRFTDTIHDAKKRIYEEEGLSGFSPSTLELRKIDVNVHRDDIRYGQFHLSADGPCLNPQTKIRDLWAEQPSQDYVHVFICLPHDVSVPTDEHPVILKSNFVQTYKDLFIKVEKRKSFQVSDISENDIWAGTSVPEFVSNFEQALDRKPGLALDVTNAYFLLDYLSITQSWEAYFEPFQNTNPEDGPPQAAPPQAAAPQAAAPQATAPQAAPPENESHEEGGWQRRDAQPLEVTHIMNVGTGAWKNRWTYTPFNEDLANAMFFSQFLFSVPENRKIIAQMGAKPWPLKLIVECADDPLVGQLRQFEPRSDFLIHKSKLPRLLVEVHSTAARPWPGDLVQMILTGAAIVRFANRFLTPFGAKNFTLVTIYIYDDGSATRFTLFQQQNGPEVYYKETKFTLDDPSSCVSFLRQFYNLFHMLEEEEEDQDTLTQVTKLQLQIKHRRLDSFNTKDVKGKKRKRSGASDDAGGGGGAAGGSAGDSADLRVHGYEVEPEDIVDDSGIVYEPLCKMPHHILTVFRPSAPGKKLTAKKIDEESNELEFLKLLNTLQPKSEHVISLLDSFQTLSSSWAILPKLDSVADYVAVAPNQFYGKVAQVCRGLIEGVRYIHKVCVAHRDIKPSNLVVDKEFSLKIIDFDLAMRVKDEDEMVNGQCGTKHWMAPELEKTLMYSPIKADRWSSGRVILYLLDEFKNEDEPLRMIGRKLTAHSPKQRPSMDEVTTLLSDMPNVARKRANNNPK